MRRRFLRYDRPAAADDQPRRARRRPLSRRRSAPTCAAATPREPHRPADPRRPCPLRRPLPRAARARLSRRAAGLARRTAFGYRIYRLDRPMMPGETRALAFRSRRQQVGFRNNAPDTRLVANGTFLNNFELAPAIGMDRFGLLQDRATRRKLRPAVRAAPAAARGHERRPARPYFGGGWSTADITVSTVADQTPIAPGPQGQRPGARTAGAPPASSPTRRSSPSSRSSRPAMPRRGGAMPASTCRSITTRPMPGTSTGCSTRSSAALDYYQANFGPYQFDQARIIEFPGYETFAQAFANTMPYSEAIGFAADNSRPRRRSTM